MENVEKVLRKYKNSQLNMRNFDKEEQIIVIDIICEAQKSYQNVLIEANMVKIQTYFAASKMTETGFFTREDWLLVSRLIFKFIDMLSTKKLNLNKKNSLSTESPVKTEDEGVDIDTFQSNDF